MTDNNMATFSGNLFSMLVNNKNRCLNLKVGFIIIVPLRPTACKAPFWHHRVGQMLNFDGKKLEIGVIWGKQYTIASRTRSDSRAQQRCIAVVVYRVSNKMSAFADATLLPASPAVLFQMQGFVVQMTCS